MSDLILWSLIFQFFDCLIRKQYERESFDYSVFLPGNGSRVNVKFLGDFLMCLFIKVFPLNDYLVHLGEFAESIVDCIEELVLMFNYIRINI